MKYLIEKSFFRLAGVILFGLLVMVSNNSYARGKPDHKITICHYPPGNINNPQTISIDKSAWQKHRTQHGDATHRDTPGACGILAGNGCFSESFTIYGMNDDFDGVAVYKLDSAEVVGLTPSLTFPNEIENLTSSQSETYYGIQANSGGSQGFYEITLIENKDGTFSGEYWKITDMEGGDYDALELIDGDFIAPHNDDNKWVKFSLDGTILAERSFADAMGGIEFPSGKDYYINRDIEDTAYDPVNNILYASHVWRAYNHNYSHLYAFDLSNGFENMVAVDLGSMYWKKIEALLYRDGSLYGASDGDNKLFKIILGADGKIVGDGKGEDVPGWDGSMSSDIEGLANVFKTENCPAVAPDFGSFGEFNRGEVNKHKVDVNKATTGGSK